MCPLEWRKMGSMKSKLPWLEGFLLACIVAAVFVVGGETVRASYHGLLHTTVGEAVWRDGLLPENPYHAGEALRYYTLYPWAGVTLGHFLGGPFWGFAWLSILAALLFGPALEALGKSLSLPYAARRAAFWAAILGFNGWGWTFSNGQETVALLGQSPIILSQSLTSFQGWSWDARLQAVLPKFLNVSSFALALAPGMWALAAGIHPITQPKKFILPGALALALNPLVGGVVALMVALAKTPLLWRHPRQAMPWLTAGVLATLLALPFLMPLFAPAPVGEQMTGAVAFQAPFGVNFFGSLGLLAGAAIWGCKAWDTAPRRRFLLGMLLLLGLAAGAKLPWANEYKLFRLLGIGLALPAGLVLSKLWLGGGWSRLVPLLLGGLCLPTTWLMVQAYGAWGNQNQVEHLQSQAGRLVVHADVASTIFPASFSKAEAHASAEAVLVMALEHPGSRLGGGVVQGNALASILHRPLFVDLPQIHNAGISDLGQRLRWVSRLFHPDASSRNQVDVLLAMCKKMASRPLLVLWPPQLGTKPHSPSLGQRVKVPEWANSSQIQVDILAEEDGFFLIQVQGQNSENEKQGN